MELVGGEDGDGLPAQLQRPLQGPVLVRLLTQEVLLEGLAELEVGFVQGGELLLAYHRGERPHLLDVGVAGEELAGEVGMVGAGEALAHRVLHQPGEGGEAGDRGVDPLALEVPLEHDLPLGDEAGEIGDGVGDVVVGHGQDGELGDRAPPAGDDPGPLVDGGEVAVEVAGVALPGRDLAPQGGDLAQGLAVVRDVGHDHQDVAVLLEGEILGQGEGGAGGGQPLDRGGVGEAQEEGDLLEGAGLAEVLDEEAGDVVLHAHGREDHAEAALLPGDRRLAGDLGRDQVVGEAGAGEDGELLAPDQRVHHVDGGEPRLDALAGILPGGRVDGQTVDVEEGLGRRLGEAVQRPPLAVEGAPEHRRGNPDPLGLAPEADPDGGEGEAGRPLEDLDHRPPLGDLQGEAGADPPLAVHHLDQLVPAHAVDPLDEDERPHRFLDPAVLQTGRCRALVHRQ